MNPPDNDPSAAETEAIQLRVPPFPRSRVPVIDRGLLLAATAAHFLNDFYVAFLAPLLPLVVAKFNLSLALAGLLATVLTTSAAMTQPLFGIIADRLKRRVFLILAAPPPPPATGPVGLGPPPSLPKGPPSLSGTCP